MDAGWDLSAECFFPGLLHRHCFLLLPDPSSSPSPHLPYQAQDRAADPKHRGGFLPRLGTLQRGHILAVFTVLGAEAFQRLQRQQLSGICVLRVPPGRLLPLLPQPRVLCVYGHQVPDPSEEAAAVLLQGGG